MSMKIEERIERDLGDDELFTVIVEKKNGDWSLYDGLYLTFSEAKKKAISIVKSKEYMNADVVAIIAMSALQKT